MQCWHSRAGLPTYPSNTVLPYMQCQLRQRGLLAVGMHCHNKKLRDLSDAWLVKLPSQSARTHHKVFSLWETPDINHAPVETGHACTHTHTNTHAHKQAHARAQAHLHTNMHVRTQAHTRACTHACKRVTYKPQLCWLHPE